MIETLEELHESQDHRRRVLERELESIRRQLVALGALRLVLFGSLAKGRVRRASDLDILAVMPDSRSGRQWTSEIYETLDRS
ncbi:MAG: nucleotidyltransferase domain-containing protein, partial [Deltaproteobacteria bacterium]|nr:nucleotidyltransferase domain-containing protein [Deltaproteobacteria bacterium]